MFDFIPVEIYTSLHYTILLLIALVILTHAMSKNLYDVDSIQFFNGLGIVVVIWYTLYMGQRQISGRYFGDTANYNKAYLLLQSGKEMIVEKDYFFNYLMMLCSKLMPVRSFFQLIDILYIIPCILFSKKYFGRFWFFCFFMFIASFSFWTYGVNGLRNGLGTAFFILGLYYYPKRLWMYGCFILGYFMHASIIIPIAAFIVSGLYKNPKIYLLIWLLAIPLSLAGGSSWNEFFSSLGFAEDRTQGYLTGGSEEYNDQFSQTGFRWDFVLYSASAIFAGWYFIFKKKITDTFYIHLFGTYCIANAFWILVITAAFSNRFAYLSWFLMAPVIAYPMLRYKLFPNQYRIVGLVLAFYYLFTYFMFLRG